MVASLLRNSESRFTPYFVFRIAKILRRHFLYERTLLRELSRCAWETLKEFFQEAVSVKDPVLGGEEWAVCDNTFVWQFPWIENRRRSSGP